MLNRRKVLIVLLSAFLLHEGNCFSVTTIISKQRLLSATALKSELNSKGEESLLTPPDQSQTEASDEKAATNTINTRLMAELDAASDKGKNGAPSKIGRKLGLVSFRSEKTDEEREAALAEARNLNGVNPVVAIVGAVVTLAAAAALWFATQWLGGYFARHPVETDFYFAQRVTQVVRNVVMGLASLGSGFFGVTGLGILMLGIRVAYGVATGELDPTPIKKKQKEEIELPNVWELMMNKKPNRRGNKSDNNPFGI